MLDSSQQALRLKKNQDRDNGPLSQAEICGEDTLEECMFSVLIGADSQW